MIAFETPLTMPRPLSMTQLAADLGYAKSTVCRALKNDPRIARRTRQRIQDEAKRRGYRPDPLVSELASRRWAFSNEHRPLPVAFLAESENLLSPEGVMGKYWLGAKRRAEERGYACEPYLMSQYRSSRHLSRVLYSRGVQGVIVGPIRSHQPLLDLDWDCFAAVSCGGDFHPPPLHKIQVNQMRTATIAYQAAIALGYRRIGAALHFHGEVSPDDCARLGAICYQQQRFSPHLPLLPIFTSRDKSAFFAWLEENRPDALIGLFPLFKDWLIHAGYRVPEDIGLIALIEPSHRYPDLAYMDHREEDIGAAAFDHLEQLLRSNQKGLPRNRRYLLTEPKLHMGETLKRRAEPDPTVAKILEADRDESIDQVHAALQPSQPLPA